MECNRSSTFEKTSTNILKGTSMNRILSLAAALVLTGVFILQTTTAQEKEIKRKDVPTAVLAAFAKTYPNAKAKEFSMETENGKTIYEIESVEGKTNRDLSYTEEGALVVIEETIGMDALPQPVQAALKKDFAKSAITRCEKVTEGPSTTFEVAMKSGKKKSEVVFNADGTIVKK